MKNFWCRFTIHDFKEDSGILIIKRDFADATPMMIGKCQCCGKIELQKYWGVCRYRESDAITKEEALKAYKEKK